VAKKDEVEAEKFKSAALSVRLDALERMDDSLQGALRVLAEWIAEAPAAISESPDGVNLQSTVEKALEDFEGRSAIGREPLLRARGALDASKTALAVSYIAARVTLAVNKKFPKLGNLESIVGAIVLLQRMAEGLSITAAWLIRSAVDVELTKAEQHAARIQRMRKRRKAGFRMIPVAVHTSDIDALVRLRLLSPRETGNTRAIEDALQAFMFASFSSTVDEFDGPLDLDKKQPADIRNRWIDRFSDFLERLRLNV